MAVKAAKEVGMHLAVLHGLGAVGTAVLPGPKSSPGGHCSSKYSSGNQRSCKVKFTRAVERLYSTMLAERAFPPPLN